MTDKEFDMTKIGILQEQEDYYARLIESMTSAIDELTDMRSTLEQTGSRIATEREALERTHGSAD